MTRNVIIIGIQTIEPKSHCGGLVDWWSGGGASIDSYTGEGLGILFAGLIRNLLLVISPEALAFQRLPSVSDEN